MRCGISFSPSPGRRYVSRQWNAFLSMSWKAWENLESVTNTGIRTRTYLVLRDNEFNNIIEQSICGKSRRLRLTAHDRIQCGLLRCTTTQELNRILDRLVTNLPNAFQTLGSCVNMLICLNSLFLAALCVYFNMIGMPGSLYKHGRSKEIERTLLT